MTHTRVSQFTAVAVRSLLAFVALALPVGGSSARDGHIRIAQTTGNTDATAAVPSAPACNPPLDVRRCAKRPILTLLQPAPQVMDEAFELVTGDGATTYYLKPARFPAGSPSATSGACDPPRDVSGCIIVPPAALNVKDVPKLTEPFLIKLLDGTTLHAFPATKQ